MRRHLVPDLIEALAEKRGTMERTERRLKSIEILRSSIGSELLDMVAKKRETREFNDNINARLVFKRL